MACCDGSGDAFAFDFTGAAITKLAPGAGPRRPQPRRLLRRAASLVASTNMATLTGSASTAGRSSITGGERIILTADNAVLQDFA
ncbi:MAG: hypothetical protein R3F11_16550 [Verrucomicrobiales bacterium]